MTFRKKAIDHLSDYKKNTMSSPYDKPGIWWINRTKDVKKYCPHILPLAEGKTKAIEQNLLPQYRADFMQSTLRKGVKFHSYAHHLNSSQLMCINFFFPLWQEGRLEDLLQVLQVFMEKDESIDYQSVGFEFQSDLDYDKSSNRATTFDFRIPLRHQASGRDRSNSRELLFEIKYTENGFGGTTHDARHKELFENIYAPHAASVLKSTWQDMDTFLDNYQLCRNLIHLDDNGSKFVVVVYPEQNEKIKSGLLRARNELLEANFEQHLKDITWESLHREITALVADSARLRAQMLEFHKKYLAIMKTTLASSDDHPGIIPEAFTHSV